MKISIKEWASDIQSPQNRLISLQKAILQHQSLHPSMQNLTVEENLLREYYKTEEELALYWQQRAKVQWQVQGDRNTAFFQAAATHRRRYNTITHIQTPEGTIVSSHSQIRQTLVNYFKSIYCPPQISEPPNPTLFFENLSDLNFKKIPESAHISLITGPSENGDKGGIG